MWVTVLECRGPNGEKLSRKDWSGPYTGDLTIQNGQVSMVARLETPDVDRRKQVLYPLFDVRVQTLEEGFLVVGCRLNVESKPDREVRQAWFCLPVFG
jgi:hypothetical protein